MIYFIGIREYNTMKKRKEAAYEAKDDKYVVFG